MLPAAVQILAFALALLGVLGAAVATMLPNWKVNVNVWAQMVAPACRVQGLWMDCVWYSSAVFSCTMKNSVLSLPPYLQATRAAMVMSCLVASLGLCLAALGLKCTRWGGSHRAKGRTAIAAGACFILSSLLCLVPASWFTNEVVSGFLNTDVPDSSKYQPGGALCVTFVSAGFLLAGGVIFCLSCPGKRRQDSSTSTNTAGLLLHAEEERRLRREVRPNETMKMDELKKQLRCSSPKPPPKDMKDSYSLQEYV
ncbi:hypothetical protein LDENG_00104750 [Lucifuga dentata]|nr:hypothetical protein LDENG_00104750 [Lucifuga dentata]